jgi:predicted amidohydrolase
VVSVPSKVVIAVAQMRIDEMDVDANEARCQLALRAAAEHGADLLVLPECALTGYRYATRSDAWEASIARDDPRLARLAEAAKADGVTVVVGFLERADDALHNTAALLSADDGCVDYVRKTHLPVLGADRFVTPGDRLGPVISAPFGRVGVAICYDFRFPEVCRALALGGADVVAVPVNWSTEVAIMSEHVVPTRAVENRVFVAVSDRVGVADEVVHLGASAIVDPMGTRLTPPIDPGPEVAVAVATADLALARSKASVFESGVFEIDVFADRRPALYDALRHPTCRSTIEEQPEDA